MIKWFKIYKNMWLGLFGLGFLFFIIREIPYIIMPFIDVTANPLMEMVDKYPILNIIEKILGTGTVISMIFVVNHNTKWFSISSTKEKLFSLLLCFY